MLHEIPRKAAETGDAAATEKGVKHGIIVSLAGEAVWPPAWGPS